MSLTGRFSALFLAAIGVVLVAFSTAIYVSARVYLGRQLEDRASAALAVLAAAAEVHPEGVEWEPQERILPLGQEDGADRLCWIVFDDQGRIIDHSRNLAERAMPEAWTQRLFSADLPDRILDLRGRAWRVSRRRILPDPAPPSGSRAAAIHQGSVRIDRSEVLSPFLKPTVLAPLGPMEATLVNLGWLLAGLGAATWLGSALLCRRLSLRALEPLTRMVESARGLDADDKGWFLPEAGTHDELDELGRAFNDLLSRLYMAYENQRRFGSDVSHQLRTPLTILLGQLELALRRERTNDEYRRALESAFGRADHLRRMIEALLFLGRTGANVSIPDVEPLDLNAWASGYLADRPGPPEDREIMFHPMDGPPLVVFAHPMLFGQLVENLLENALKYGDPGTSITVEAYRESGAAVLAVEDTGPGIPPEELSRIFEPFYRSPRARRGGVPGVGLGLAVVQRIAAAFGAAVTAGAARGGGCRIEVRFPVATAVGGLAGGSPRPPVDTIDNPVALPPSTSRPKPASTQPVAPPTSGTSENSSARSATTDLGGLE